MESFKSWLEQVEKHEGFGGFVKGAASGITNLATQALGLPGPDELGLNTDGIKTAASYAWNSVKDQMGPLTPAQIEYLRNQCFTMNNPTYCKILCKRLNNAKACSKAGYSRVGRRWIYSGVPVS